MWRHTLFKQSNVLHGTGFKEGCPATVGLWIRLWVPWCLTHWFFGFWRNHHFLNSHWMEDTIFSSMKQPWLHKSLPRNICTFLVEWAMLQSIWRQSRKMYHITKCATILSKMPLQEICYKDILIKVYHDINSGMCTLQHSLKLKKHTPTFGNHLNQ